MITQDAERCKSRAASGTFETTVFYLKILPVTPCLMVEVALRLRSQCIQFKCFI